MMNYSEKGFAMVLSLVLLLAMSLMGGALILIASGDHQSNNTSDQYQQTFYVAETALLEGERYLLNQKAGPWDSKTNSRDITKRNLPEKHTSLFKTKTGKGGGTEGSTTNIILKKQKVRTKHLKVRPILVLIVFQKLIEINFIL